METAFGDARTFSASDQAKTMMKQLVSKGLFAEQRDAWMLGAAVGLAEGQVHEGGNRETFQNVNSLDPEGLFAGIMLGLYPKLAPDQRVKKLVDHAEWGIREIFRKNENGTLDWASIGLLRSQARPG